MAYGNYYFYGLVLTSLTGSICYLLWLLVKVILKRYKFVWNERFYFFLQMTFVLPVLFVGLMVYHQDQTLIIRLTKHNAHELFGNTQVTIAANRVFFLVWGIAVGIFLVYQSRRIVAVRSLMKGTVPVDDPRMEVMFAEVKEALGIRRDVRLLQSDLLDVPSAAGVFRQVVILPMHGSASPQMRMVFLHELTHLKYHHTVLKLLMIFVHMVNVLNPLVYIFRKNLSLELEKLCDRRVCAYLREDSQGTVTDYYQMILNSMTGGVIEKQVETIGFPLVRKASDLQRRITDMQEYQNTKAIKKGMAVLLTLCLIFGSSLTVFAAGEGVVQFHQALYDATKVWVEAEPFVNTLEEHEFTANMWDDFTVEIMNEDGIVTYGTFNGWNISAHGGTKSGTFYLHTGDTVSVSVQITPNNLTVRVGLDYPNGSGTYVLGSGVITHVFTAPMDGNYDFFIANPNAQAVTATGAYLY